MAAQDYRATIANRLKTYRKETGMSLDAVAEATHVSKAMLGQIERLESVPTIATLWKIAGGLALSFSSFFGEDPTSRPDHALFPNDPNMDVSIIFPFDPATRMEMFEIILRKQHRQQSTAHQIGVVEHVIVRQGCLELQYENKSVQLSEGQAVRFHADIPHEYKAVTETVRFQNIICYT